MDDLVRTYLCEISRIPLLSHEQEIVYGNQVQQMMSLLKAKEKLTKKLHRDPTTKEWALNVLLSESELKQTIQQGQRAKHKMIEANLRLVVYFAKKYQKRSLELLDLIQEGTIGLIQGAEKFDPKCGYKFSTYAYKWIRQAIVLAIAEKSRTVRLPRYVLEKLNKIKKVQYHLSQQMGREPNASELAAATGLAPKRVLDYLEWARLPISLNLRLIDDQDTELGEFLSDAVETPEMYVMQLTLSMDLKKVLMALTPQQREVLALRFGLVDGQALSRTQIGDRLSISAERVRLIELKTLYQLRRDFSASM